MAKMKQTGLIIGYDLLEPKGDDKLYREDRKKDRGELRKHLRKMKAIKLQRSLWYVKTKSSSFKLKTELYGLTRKVTEGKVEKSISLLIPGDRIVISPTRRKMSVWINLLDG